MPGLAASGVPLSRFHRTVEVQNQTRDLKMREPLRNDLGNSALNEVRDQLVDTVMNIAELAARNDNREGLDSDPEVGRVVLKDVTLYPDSASVGLAAGGGREVRVAKVELKDSPPDSDDYEGADPTAVYVHSASLGYSDGSTLRFRQEAGILTFTQQNPDEQISRMKISANGDVEWNIHDPANYGRTDWAH